MNKLTGGRSYHWDTIPSLHARTLEQLKGAMIDKAKSQLWLNSSIWYSIYCNLLIMQYN